MRLVAADVDEMIKEGLDPNEGESQTGDLEKSKSGKVGRGLIPISVIPLFCLETGPKISDAVDRDRAGTGEGVILVRLLLELLLSLLASLDRLQGEVGFDIGVGGFCAGEGEGQGSRQYISSIRQHGLKHLTYLQNHRHFQPPYVSPHIVDLLYVDQLLCTGTTSCRLLKGLRKPS
jgi:hypothetical protein